MSMFTHSQPGDDPGTPRPAPLPDWWATRHEPDWAVIDAMLAELGLLPPSPDGGRRG